MFKLLIPENAGIYRTAAEIFLDFSRRMTGFSPEIVTEDDHRTPMVVFGNDAENRFVMEWMKNRILGSLGIRYGSDDYSLTSFRADDRNLLLIA